MTSRIPIILAALAEGSLKEVNKVTVNKPMSNQKKMTKIIIASTIKYSLFNGVDGVIFNKSSSIEIASKDKLVLA